MIISALEKEYRITNVTIHPKFPIDSHKFNIAIIRVEKSFDTSTFTPIKLYQPGNLFLESMFSVVAGISGEESAGPQLIFVMTVDDEICKSYLEKQNIKLEGLICTGSFEFNDENVCPSVDSSLLIIDNQLAGIAALSSCDLDSILGVFTEISFFYDWINGIIKI